VRLRKEVTERDARAAASAAHVLAVQARLNTELEEARTVAAAVSEESDRLRAIVLHQAQASRRCRGYALPARLCPPLRCNPVNIDVTALETVEVDCSHLCCTFH
jgi:hypothetical protein